MARTHGPLVLALCLAASLPACAGGSRSGPPSLPKRGSSEVHDPELDHAIASWHDEDDLEPLRAWVKRHPEAPAAELWREVVALHSYEAQDAETDHPEQQLRSIATEYPDTLAGQVATLTLVGDRLGSLYAAVPGPLAADFLDGGDAWSRASDGTSLAGIDLTSVSDHHGAPIRDAMARALLAEHCDETMGYCNWWVTRYPGDPRTASIKAEIAESWYRRGHPRWAGNRHARCALRCAKACRERATPLDDTCYSGCYNRC